MDQCKHKGHLLKLYYRTPWRLRDISRVQRDRLPSIHNNSVKECREDGCGMRDRYLSISLKDSARKKGGKDSRGGVRPDTRIPWYWTASLRIDENKQELFFTGRAAYPNWNWPWRRSIYQTWESCLKQCRAELTPQIYYLACTKKLRAAGAARRGYWLM